MNHFDDYKDLTEYLGVKGLSCKGFTATNLGINLTAVGEKDKLKDLTNFKNLIYDGYSKDSEKDGEFEIFYYYK